MRRLFPILTLICVLMLPAWDRPLSGQTPLFSPLTEDDGLTSNYQWCSHALLRDQYGFIWITTQRGLNRFDGYDVLSFTGNTLSEYDLPNNKLTAITEDGKGRIWIGTDEEGIIIYDRKKEKFSRFKSENFNPDSLVFGQINELQSDHSGNVLIGTAFQGVYRFDVEAEVLERVKVYPESSPSRGINTFQLLHDGRLVILAYNGIYLQKKDGTFRHFPVDRNQFLSGATELPDGTVRIRMQNRSEYFVLNTSTQELTLVQNAGGALPCGGNLDSDKNLWTSYDNGLLVSENLRSGNVDSFFLQVEHPLPDQLLCLRAMLDDGKGSMYYMSLSSGAGKFNYRPLPFTLLQDEPSAVLFSSGKGLFLTKRDSLFFSDGKALTRIPLAGKAGAPIFDYVVDQDGEYWISYESEPPVFVHYNKNGDVISEVTPGRLSSQMVRLKDGEMTVGSRNAEVTDATEPYRFIGSYYEGLTGADFPDFRAQYYTQLPNGDIWIATRASGLMRIVEHGQKCIVFPVDGSGNGALNSDNPYYIYALSSGEVLVCTDKGINIWDPATEEFSYLTDPSVNLQEIRGIAERDDGVVWLITISHVHRYRLADKTLSSFALPSAYKATNAEPRDLPMDAAGNLYYRSVSGIVRVDVRTLESIAEPARVVFTGLYVNRSRVHAGDASHLLDSSVYFQHALNVPYALRDLGFSFVSPFGKESGARYAYRLKGYREEWEVAPPERAIYYTSLRPGRYSFQVRAVSATGNWTKEVSSIDFCIAPPWYQRWWAYLLYAVAASVLAYAFYRYRINQLLKYQQLRTRISSDLHDDVGSILGSIAMESEMLAYESDPEKAPLLRRLSTLSREAMGRMRDTVWAIDSRKDNLEFLTDRMKDYLTETLSRSQFAFQFMDDTQLEGRHISPDVRQNVYLIFKEAINNILRHSNGWNVLVRLSKEKSGFLLVITDDGTVNKPVALSGLGLSNMHLRAESIRAELSINTKDGFVIRLKFHA